VMRVLCPSILMFVYIYYMYMCACAYARVRGINNLVTQNDSMLMKRVLISITIRVMGSNFYSNKKDN